MDLELRSDMVVAHGADGRGVGSAMLAFAERLALGVFPGNARALYERHGFGVELLRMVKPLAR